MNVEDSQPVITLLTDYGTTDEFVGVLHGVIARICPEARVIDLAHGVPRQDVRAGATVLAHSLPYMPVGVHVPLKHAPFTQISPLQQSTFVAQRVLTVPQVEQVPLKHAPSRQT